MILKPIIGAPMLKQGIYMTLEDKQKRLAELRVMWKKEPDPVKRKIIEKRAWMIKKTIHTLIDL